MKTYEKIIFIINIHFYFDPNIVLLSQILT